VRQVGIIGLGKMGYNLALNMIDNDILVFGYDKFINKDLIENSKLVVLTKLQDLVTSLARPRVIWMMVPSGETTENLIDELGRMLSPNDIIIDGGNSRYTDTIRRYKYLKEFDISLVDCGTSGGVNGARYGASLMVGGDLEVVKSISWLFESLAIKDGYAYIGESGSGHFVKMVHNGIEYGMMQAIGEGFDLLEHSHYELNYKDVARVWANGSIIQGLLMDVTLSALSKDEKLTSIAGRIDDSGEGQWTIEEALKLKVSIPVIAASLFARYKSRDDLLFSEKIVASMRNEFGGHKVYKKK